MELLLHIVFTFFIFCIYLRKCLGICNFLKFIFHIFLIYFKLYYFHFKLIVLTLTFCNQVDICYRIVILLTSSIIVAIQISKVQETIKHYDSKYWKFFLCHILYKRPYIRRNRKKPLYGDPLYKNLKLVKWRWEVIYKIASDLQPRTARTMTRVYWWYTGKKLTK